MPFRIDHSITAAHQEMLVPYLLLNRVAMDLRQGLLPQDRVDLTDVDLDLCMQVQRSPDACNSNEVDPVLTLNNTAMLLLTCLRAPCQCPISMVWYYRRVILLRILHSVLQEPSPGLDLHGGVPINASGQTGRTRDPMSSKVLLTRS